MGTHVDEQVVHHFLEVRRAEGCALSRVSVDRDTSHKNPISEIMNRHTLRSSWWKVKSTKQATD
jgi:hypothetical protein